MYDELSQTEIEDYAETYFSRIKDHWLDKEPYMNSLELLKDIEEDLGCSEGASAEIVSAIVDERKGELLGVGYRVGTKEIKKCFCINLKYSSQLINGELDFLLN